MLDWFTIIAQVVNFLVLVALLRRFLYGPIIKAMDAREERIAGALQEARQQQLQAEEQARLYQQKNEELEEQRHLWLTQMRDEVDNLRKELMHRARKEVEEQQESWIRALQQEKNSFVQETGKRLGTQVQRVVKRTLADLADEKLEARIIETFIRRLDGLSEEDRDAIISSLTDSKKGLTVVSAHEMTSGQQGRVREALQEHFQGSYTIEFSTSPDLVAGVALKSSHHTVSWNLAEYISSLENEVAAVLEEELRSRSRAAVSDSAPA